MTEYDIALRPDSTGALDDVVIRDVSMFRAERMDDNLWWMCCYLGPDYLERVNFFFSYHQGVLDVEVNEWPRGFSYEPGSLLENGERA